MSVQRMDVMAVSAAPVAAVRLPVEGEGTVAMRRRQSPEAQWAIHGCCLPGHLGEHAGVGRQDRPTSPRTSGRPSIWPSRSPMHLGWVAPRSVLASPTCPGAQLHTCDEWLAPGAVAVIDS